MAPITFQTSEINNSVAIVATHSGVFHADEVTAVALVILAIEQGTVEIYRTRDTSILAKCHTRIDVGGVYDPVAGDFDHHQQGYTGTLSSAGMVHKYILTEDCDFVINGAKYTSENLAKLIDDVDKQDIGTKYQEAFHYCNIISSYNCEDIYSKEQDMAFEDAVLFAVRFITNLTRKDKQKVIDKIASKAIEIDTYEFGRVAVVPKDSQYLPSTLFIGRADLLVSWDDQQDCWTVSTVPLKEEEFGSLLTLLKTGRNSEIFTHKAGFIGKYKEENYLPISDPFFTSGIVVKIDGIEKNIPIGDEYLA